jgi:hypothetical protein
LLTKLRNDDWDSEFGGGNDGVVPLTSENDRGSAAASFSGIIHSSGLEILGFNGPTELDATTPIPGKVVELLNTPAPASVFRHLGP